MTQHMKNTINIPLCTLLLLLLSYPLEGFGQDKFLKIKGKVLKRYDQKRLKAPVQIQAVSTCGDTNTINIKNGKYKLYLSPGCDYEVHYKSEDYVDKYFVVETTHVHPKFRKKRFSLPVDIMMVRKVDGLDTSIYKYAQGKAFFHKVLRTFVWDPEFTSKAIIKADSAWMNISAGDSLKVVKKEPQNIEKEKPFDPLYLFVLQKDIPTKKIIDEGYTITRKGLYFDTVQHGIIYAKMNLSFIAKQEGLFQGLCDVYKSYTRTDKKCTEILDEKPKQFQQELFKLGVLIEQLMWVSKKEVFAMMDYEGLINSLNKTLNNWDTKAATDHVLSMKADFMKIIENYKAIRPNDDLKQQIANFKTLIQEIHTNLK